MSTINPFESGISKTMDNQKIDYSADKKAKSGLVWAVVSVCLLVLGFFSSQVSIFFVLIVCAVSVYYANSAKKAGSVSKKIKSALIISSIVAAIDILVFIINILAALVKK
jgi:uncharacterized membrane protein